MIGWSFLEAPGTGQLARHERDVVPEAITQSELRGTMGGAEPVGAAWQVPTEKRVRVPSVLHCGLWIFAIKVALRTRGFGRTIHWIRRRVETVRATASIDADTVKAVDHAVAMAGALYPGRGLCLEQSLVLYYVLRRQGVPVNYCQGVQPHPFAAHAWVEYDGKPINDVPEHVGRFARLPDQLP